MPPQSIFSVASPDAALMQEVAWVLFGGALVIFVFVMVLVARGAISGPTEIRGNRWLLGGGVIFPVAVLTALLIYGLRVGAALSHDAHSYSEAADGQPSNTAEDEMLRVHVIGRRWWWEARYHMSNGREEAVLANELHLPMGVPADLTLTTADVIHSFWIPALAGKIDMIPGHRNRLVIRPDRPGVFRGQCAEYCGTQHAQMAFEVVVEPPVRFAEWLSGQAKPAREPATALLREGRDAFFRGGCHACHTIRGTEARGQLGPDLTHVGSRRTLAAGVLRNHPGAMAGWIANTQALKPASLMPTMNVFTGPELLALSAYLESLE